MCARFIRLLRIFLIFFLIYIYIFKEQNVCVIGFKELITPTRKPQDVGKLPLKIQSAEL